MTKGGKRDGAGRPAGTNKPATKPRAIRMTDEQHAKYVELGGAKWAQRMINEAIGEQLYKSKDRKFSPNNWAYQALIYMDEADTLVRHGSVCMQPDKYRPAADAFWRVARLLSDERDRIEETIEQANWK